MVSERGRSSHYFRQGPVVLRQEDLVARESCVRVSPLGSGDEFTRIVVTADSGGGEWRRPLGTTAKTVRAGGSLRVWLFCGGPPASARILQRILFSVFLRG